MPDHAAQPLSGTDLAAFTLAGTALAIGFGIVLLVVSLVRRRREAVEAQARAERNARFYQATARANALIAHAPDRPALFAGLCRICVEVDASLRASITVVRDGHGERIAWAGRGADIFTEPDLQRWPLAGPGAPASLTQQALDRGTSVVSHDFQREAPVAEWRERARRHDMRSIAAFPFRCAGRVAGALTLYAPAAGVFTPELVTLFDGLAGELSFALDNAEREAARVQAMQRAEAGFARFRQLFDSAPVCALIMAVPSRRVVDINATCCAFYGVERDEAIGRVPDELGFGSIEEDRQPFYEQMAAQGRVRDFQARVRLCSGEMREVLINAELIEYDGERCVLTTTQDLTELRRTERMREELAAARAASRAKTEFLSRMSHELRTPLNAVLGFSRLLQEHGALLPAEQRDQVAHIHQAGWHLLSLIDDVLDVARIEAGQLKVELLGTELAPVLDAAVRLSEHLARQYGIHLDAAYRSGRPLAVVADAMRLRQVVINLVSNAIKYNRPGGDVRLLVEARGEHVVIEVADTGLGMTGEQLAHLFEPFNRLGRERGGIEGSGIGLVLSRQLVQLMGGQLDIESEAGRGTRVRVTLARTAALPMAMVPQERAEPPAPPAGVVLCIEDNPVNMLLVEQMLARWKGVRLLQASDGAHGIELARRVQPDLVLLDMQLPDMSGLDVLRALKGTSPPTCAARIVVLSASAMPNEVAAATAAGADAYWTKPLELERFLDGVTGQLRHAGGA